MAQFQQEPNQGLSIQQCPLGSGPDSGSGLKDFYVTVREFANHLVHILNFEENVMDPAALLLQEFVVRVFLSFQGLDQLQFQGPDLREGLAQLDVFFFSPEVIPGVWPVRPLDYAKRSNA